jgi:fluoroacetyl-CoA thioesterase
MPAPSVRCQTYATHIAPTDCVAANCSARFFNRAQQTACLPSRLIPQRHDSRAELPSAHELQVDMPDHLAGRFKDVTLPPVLATPVMIMVIENAALYAIKPYFDAGESALGTRVDVRHLAATPLGRRVTAEATVTHVNGRRIEFSIRATEGDEEIGTGTHERVVGQLSKLAERMKAKFGERCDDGRCGHALQGPRREPDSPPGVNAGCGSFPDPMSPRRDSPKRPLLYLSGGYPGVASVPQFTTNPPFEDFGRRECRPASQTEITARA